MSDKMVGDYMEDFFQFITEKAIILMPALYILGIILKKTPHISDWLIPWILLVVGATGAVFLTGETVNGIIQGILVTGSTVLAHQLYKQTSNRNR